MQPRGFERITHDNVVVPCESLPAIDLTLWQENRGASLGQSHFDYPETSYYYKRK
ncbi:hypothetical protein ILUMI_18696 [Ignelater luminosus]|uniref:Uncharacterized protein n=1 Tax=Ignelater luminosus TaxID=2038154 RepID=A0A8K0CLL0_IGNLU|nr:hypothetical protein ILUMI_18696 [Ignelater luminosus]